MNYWNCSGNKIILSIAYMVPFSLSEAKSLASGGIWGMDDSLKIWRYPDILVIPMAWLRPYNSRTPTERAHPEGGDLVNIGFSRSQRNFISFWKQRLNCTPIFMLRFNSSFTFIDWYLRLLISRRSGCGMRDRSLVTNGGLTTVFYQINVNNCKC